MGIGRDVVGFPRLGVCMEQKVDATRLLVAVSKRSLFVEHGSPYSCGQSHASRDEIVGFRLVRSHHAKLGLGNEVDHIVDLGFEINFFLIGLLIWVGGLIASRSIGK